MAAARSAHTSGSEGRRRGQVRPQFADERRLGQAERGEVRVGPEAARGIAAEHQEAHADRGPLLRLMLRVKILLVLADAMPLYVLSELTHAVRGTYWPLLDRHVDRLDHQWCRAAEEACNSAGDHVFVNRLTVLTERFTGAVDQVLNRLTKS